MCGISSHGGQHLSNPRNVALPGVPGDELSSLDPPPNFLLFSPCLLFQEAQRGMLKGAENDGDYRARFIQTVNFSHSGYKVN